MNKIHFKAQSGWINDPNGLCFFQGQYHIFYQYFPYDLEWGTMHWGHATTKDFINYEHHPIALFPSTEEDQNGVFSGSALVEDNIMNLFYTGVKYINFGDDIHRYGDKLFESTQLKISTEDGFTFDNFKGKEVIIPKLDRPVGDPIHTRDPKVWKKADKYYLIMGSNIIVDGTQQGVFLLYQSEDLKKFKYLTSHTKSNMGHMWECPDYFEIEDRGYAILSPEGTMPNCEYPSHVYTARAEFNYKDKFEFTSDLKLFDIGLDCYAPQSFEDEFGNRVIISWMRMPEAIEDNAIGVFTMPRIIKINEESVWYEIHPLIRNKFEVCETTTEFSCDEVVRIQVELGDRDIVSIGNYNIVNNNGIIAFDRTGIFPLEDEVLNKVCSENYEGKVELDIYYDGYIVETFIRNGVEVCSQVIYETENTITINTCCDFIISKLEMG